MRRPLLQLAMTLLLALPTAVPAQVSIDITGGAVGALPIAIVPFQTEGGGQAPVDIAEVVTNDLRRTGLFEPLPRERFFSQPGRFEDVRFQSWRALGADNLVVGTVRSIDGDSWQVRFELLDVYDGRRLTGKSYRVSADNLRTLAHTISNEIFQAIIGRPGGFNTRIAYVAVEGDTAEERSFRLVVADADGHSPQTILTSRASILSPAWSPDRSLLAYVSFENDRSEIFVQEVGTGERRKVASYPGINSAPAWSPDGSRLALTLSKGGNPDIYVLDLATDELRQVTDAYAIDTEPVWTPDGGHLVFTSDRAGGPQIYRIPARGGRAERLTFEGDYNASPDISPNGQLLAMVHRTQDGFQIAVKDLESGFLRVLTNGPLDESPSFSANDAAIVYTGSGGDETTLATVSIHGRAQQTLGNFEYAVREPAWSPL